MINLKIKNDFNMLNLIFPVFHMEKIFKRIVIVIFLLVCCCGTGVVGLR